VSLFFTNRVFALSSLAALLMYTTTFSILVLVSLHLQYLKGLAPTQAGLVMFAQPLVVALMSPVVGRLSDRLEPRVLATLGVVITGLGLGMLAAVKQASSLNHIMLCLVLTGLGFSLFAVTNMNAIMSSIGRGQQGAASSAVASMRVLGQVCSMGLVAMAFSLTMGEQAIRPETYPALEQALRFSFALAAAICVPCALCSLVRGQLRPEGGKPA
jgi:MFS family permease